MNNRRFYQFLNLVCVLLICGALFIVKNITMASGRVEYCSIEPQQTTGPTTYQVKGHIPWRGDRVIARDIKDPTDARHIAVDIYSCELHLTFEQKENMEQENAGQELKEAFTALSGTKYRGILVTEDADGNMFVLSNAMTMGRSLLLLTQASLKMVTDLHTLEIDAINQHADTEPPPTSPEDLNSI